MAETSLSLHLVSTLVEEDSAVGRLPVSWSQDNCISVGTGSYTLTYDLNPLKDVSSPDVPFKSQVIAVSSKLQCAAEVSNFWKGQDDVRSSISRNAAIPNFNTYLIYIHHSVDEEAKNPGIQAACFSPCGCTLHNGTVLVILSTRCHLHLYVKTSDGMAIQWTKLLDLSEVLLAFVSQNRGYLKNDCSQHPNTKWSTEWEKQLAVCINYAIWSNVCPGKDPYVFLITCTKTNHILLWRFKIPIISTTVAEIVSFSKISDDEIKSMTSLKHSFTTTGTCDAAVGGICGTVVCMSFGKDGQLVRKCKVWKEKDELAVTCMDWSFHPVIKGVTDLLAGKGSIILHMRMTADFQLLSTSILKYPQPFPVVGMVLIEPNLWLTASSDGNIMKIWLESPKGHTELTRRNHLKCEVLEEPGTASDLFCEMTHQIVASPNLAFLALLKSIPKVSRSILTGNSAHLEIRTLKTGMESFERLCLKGANGDPPPMDSLESVRQHLLRRRFSEGRAGITLLQACIKRFVTEKAEPLHLKWCLAKASGSNSVNEETLLRLEKELVSNQMLKVLKWWVKAKPAPLLPVKNMLKWLKENRSIIQEEDWDFIERTRNCEKCRKSADEVCSITGEQLIMSVDARHAITLASRISWPRCCLTFVALQGFGSRKCEVSKVWGSNSKKHGEFMLDSRSIYSGLPMI